MRVLARVLLVLATFFGVGYLAMHLLLVHAMARGASEVSVRMGAALGGLFAGGGASTLVLLALLLGGSSSREEHTSARDK